MKGNIMQQVNKINGECCTHCKKSKKKHSGLLQLLTAIPWCCIISTPLVVLSAFTAVVPIAAVATFDGFFHQYLLVPAVIIHLIGLVWYFGFDKHKSSRLTKFYIGSSVLFVLSMGFHFTPLHDHLYGVHEHHDHSHQ